jgi:hypothetical protein
MPMQSWMLDEEVGIVFRNAAKAGLTCQDDGCKNINTSIIYTGQTPFWRLDLYDEQ